MSTKRLREEPADPGSSQHAAIELLRAARPLEPSPLAKARVRAALAREPAARGPWAFRAAAVVVLLGAGSVAARATLAERWRAWRGGYTPAAGPIAAPPARSVAPAAVVLAAPVEPAALAQAPPPVSAARVHPHHRARPVDVAPAPPADDPRLVATALRALRVEHDARRAGQLVEEYLRAHPRGALVEEAMALSVEAAAARRDAVTPELAARYLGRFPNGRFRDVVARFGSAPASPPARLPSP
jgi:hypothetical protein